MRKYHNWDIYDVKYIKNLLPIVSQCAAAVRTHAEPLVQNRQVCPLQLVVNIGSQHQLLGQLTPAQQEDHVICVS